MSNGNPVAMLQALAMESRSNPAAALARCEAMLERSPRLVPILCLAGRLHRELGDLAKARNRLDRALALAPRTPAALLELGMVELASGRPLRAADYFQQYNEGHPERAQGWYQLGVARETSGAWRDAADAYRQALERGTDDPAHVRLRLAGVLARDGQATEAAALYRSVLAEAPDDVEAWLGLGMVAAATGDRPGAEAAYREALARNPDLAFARQQLVSLKDVTDPDDPDLAALTALVQREDLAAEAREQAGYGCAKALLDLGRPEEAFAAAERANRDREQRVGGFDARAWRQRVADIRISESSDPAAGEEMPHDGPAPVFLLTAPRAGATLLEQMLTAHSALASRGEDPVIECMLATHAPDWPHRRPDAAALAAMRAAYVEKGGATVNKYPGNLRIAGILRRLFPKARFVRVARDPRDAGLSMFMRDFPDAARFSTDLEAIRSYLEGHEALAGRWQELFPQAIRQIAYEDLVTEPEQTLRELVAWLGLPWEPACLDPAANTAAVTTLSHADVRRPVHAAAVGRWRQFGDLLGPLLEMQSPEARP
jgi:tetratricopeptide (TPR) repeat protein